ncbi:MalY/PatB family protein [Aerococcus sp. UMB7834]|uniref:MalY/PatB family protein n=1 Tax=Aerococcus sp. UMB7834 TaxID=3046342 RepID=UPI00254A896A|nr:MalY/PatB family protein [Aerococcus sp. UMB7834]MDK6805762.1 MalY/PatB family protein [Aerococcus sp. UMB7834]
MDKETFIKNYAVKRQNTQSLKWDLLEERFGDANLLPLWVADAEFKTPDSVRQALHDKIDHGVFGYTFVSDDYYEAFFTWMADHFDLHLEKDWIRFTTGVVQALYYFVYAYTQPGDSILIQTPVYYPFHNAARDTGRRLITCDLKAVDNHFEINYAAFEQAIIDGQVKLYIHCSPHNPAGRVWTEEEMDKLFAICEKHGVLIVSDEIHQDFNFSGRPQIPALNVAGGKYRDRIVAVNAASKTFNMATLLQSHVMISDDQLRAQYDQVVNRLNLTENSMMGLIATEAAYRGGADWLEGFKATIYSNYTYLKDRLAQELPEAKVTDLEGTYLMFVELPFVQDQIDMENFIQDRCGLAVDYGNWFGANFGDYIRLNLATIPENIEQAADALIKESRRLLDK